LRPLWPPPVLNLSYAKTVQEEAGAGVDLVGCSALCQAARESHGMESPTNSVAVLVWNRMAHSTVQRVIRRLQEVGFRCRVQE
jgi:hypothetical protein